MAFRTQKISQMTPKGADLEATDLIEVSTIESGSYVTRSITGQELIDAIPAPTGFVPETRTLTINGVTQDLSADRTFTIATGLTVGTTPISSGTIGRVLFQGTGNVLQQSGNLFWDSTNNRLGIGTSTPAHNLAVKSSSLISTIHNQNSGVGGQYFITNGSEAAYMTGGASFNGTSWVAEATSAVLFGTFLGDVRIYANKSLTTGNTFTPTERFAIFGSTGNIGINTTTDAGFRLDVNGTARVQGQFTASSVINVVSGSTTLDRDGVFLRMHGTSGIKLTTWNAGYVDALTVQATTGNVGIGTTNPSTLLHVAGNITIGGASATTVSSTYNSTTRNQIRYTNGASFEFHEGVNERVRLAPASGNVLINTTTDAGFRLDVNGTARVNQTLRVNGTGTATLIDLAGNGSILQHSTGYIFKSSSAANMLTVLNNFVGVNSITDIPSAVLAADSTTRGFLPPRMTTTQKNAIASPATGLQVYDTTLNQMSYYNGTTWTNI